jgi:hypothetical protein
LKLTDNLDNTQQIDCPRLRNILTSLHDCDSDPYAPSKIVGKNEILAHLTAYRKEVDRAIHSLPGILSGVSCANVIQISMSLIWHIDGLKAALVDALLKEGYHGGNRQNIGPTTQHNPMTVVHKPNHTTYDRQYEHTVPVTGPITADPRDGQHHIYEAIKPLPMDRPIAPTPVIPSNYGYRENDTHNSQIANMSRYYSDPYDNQYNGTSGHHTPTASYQGYTNVPPPPIGSHYHNTDNGMQNATHHNVAQPNSMNPQ